ncbi:MAG: PorT family protein, partial [Chlorobi bacterium]|nr:PorT family protein [Chlorobiota bacterium]
MKKKIILAFLLFPFAASGQKDSITDYKPEKYETKFGPSKRHYAYAYFNFLFATPPDENNDAEIFYGKTHSISYGVRYRLKITNFFAVGTGINYTYSVWHFKQTENKKIPTSEIYDKEKIKIHTLEEDIFLRFKTKKKKNSAENFLDAGIYGNWDFSDKRQYKIYTDD